MIFYFVWFVVWGIFSFISSSRKIIKFVFREFIICVIFICFFWDYRRVWRFYLGWFYGGKDCFFWRLGWLYRFYFRLEVFSIFVVVLSIFV